MHIYTISQAGGLTYTFYPAFLDMTLVMGHPSVPISAGYVAKLLGENVITSMLTPPSMLEDIYKTPGGLEGLQQLKHIGYAGGPLQPSVSF